MCTSLTFSSDYDPLISARTMDFVDDIWTYVNFVPRNQPFPDFYHEGEIHWKNKYGFIGMKSTLPGTDLSGYTDGLNEKGLSAAALWLECSSYPKPVSGKPLLYTMNVVGYMLGNFKNVREIENHLSQIQIIDISNVHPNAKAPIHFIFSDESANHLILEFVNGEMKKYTDTMGVLTNEPPFDWHLINLQNYENLSLDNNPNQISWGDELYGSGQLGIPGDPTPASRFIRSELLRRSSFRPQDEQQSIGLAVQVLQTIALPCGTVNIARSKGKYDWTQWSVIRNHTNRSIYFYSAFNSHLFGIHLKELNMNNPEQKSIDIIQPDWYKDITHYF